MADRGNENQLKKALEEGNLIIVGQKSILKDKEKEMVPIDSKFNKSFLKYNLPIGIDFGKSLKPNNFLTSLEILDRTLQIPKISEKNRFKLENLRLFLTTGKIWHYKHELNLLLTEKEEVEKVEVEKVEKDNGCKEGKSHEEILENHFISLLISLNFILNQASTTKIKWVSKNQILKFIDSQDQKNMLRQWKTNNYGKLQEDTVFLSLISQTLIHQISLLDFPKIQKSELNNLINLAISAKFSKIRQITSDKLKLISSFHVPTPNLTKNSVSEEKSPQNQHNINNKTLYNILDTLKILQNE